MSSGASLRETDIRPASLMEEQERRFNADIARMLARRSEFITVACPACGVTDGRREFEKNSIPYDRCAKCGTLYVNPRPSPSVLDEYYSTSENYAYWNAVIFPASEATRREHIFRPRVRRLLDICGRYGVAMGTMLEVGSGFGTFCEELRDTRAFKRILAVEPTPGLAASCRERGIEVIEAPIERVDTSTVRADVIASFEVVEHLFEPRDFLLRCAEILAPGGLLLLTCPNVEGFDILTLGALSGAVDPEHLNYFSPHSLSLLLRNCGFTVLESSTPGKLDAELVRNKVLSGAFDLANQRFLRRVLIEKWDELGDPFQSFLANHGLSSHLWLVARKP